MSVAHPLEEEATNLADVIRVKRQNGIRGSKVETNLKKSIDLDRVKRQQGRLEEELWPDHRPVCPPLC